MGSQDNAPEDSDEYNSTDEEPEKVLPPPPKVIVDDRPFGSLKIQDHVFMGDRTAAKVSPNIP